VTDEPPPGIDDEAGPLTPRWSVVANVVDERLWGQGAEVRRGTRVFSPGTKVYLIRGHWGEGGERVDVLGRARRTKRWVRSVVASSHLENWRAMLIHEPSVLRRLTDDEIRGDHRRAQDLAEGFTRMQPWRRQRLVVIGVEEARARAMDLQAHTEVSHMVIAPEPNGGAVLFDGVRPIAVVLFHENNEGPGAFQWCEVWAVTDPPGTQAALINAVVNGYGHPDHSRGRMFGIPRPDGPPPHTEA
jgi:hypothetical protein